MYVVAVEADEIEVARVSGMADSPLDPLAPDAGLEVVVSIAAGRFGRVGHLVSRLELKPVGPEVDGFWPGGRGQRGHAGSVRPDHHFVPRMERSAGVFEVRPVRLFGDREAHFGFARGVVQLPPLVVEPVLMIANNKGRVVYSHAVEGPSILGGFDERICRRLLPRPVG